MDMTSEHCCPEESQLKFHGIVASDSIVAEGFAGRQACHREH